MEFVISYCGSISLVLTALFVRHCPARGYSYLTQGDFSPSQDLTCTLLDPVTPQNMSK